MQRTLTYLWQQPSAPKSYRCAVSLHGHTNHSKEGLYFIAEFAAKHALLRWALAHQERRASDISAITIDFWKSYWTPPMPALAAFQLERNHIENALGLSGMVSLSDHDNIEAPMLLRVIPEARRIPVSLEWTVPFRDTTLHLGLHNLPSARAEAVVADLQEFTRNPVDKRLEELLSMLNESRDVLVVLNHPMWDLAGIGGERHASTLSAFMAKHGMFIHALELGGLRSWEENQRTVHFAEGWNQPIIGGGDRHGCEPSAVLNLTNAENFSEFVHEIRRERRTHVLFMPQYAEPQVLRIIQTLRDVIRDYPEYPAGSQRWDERIFHPDHNGVIRPLAALWTKPEAFIEIIFAVVRLVDMHPVRGAIQRVFGKLDPEMQFDLGKGQEVVL
ncbi:MAG: hypothetical protein J2P13_07755 [Acidobacteria bacterium]|nr:hypothetical protein [Acidobacteriota bacterium]